ncbi:MAG: hypothetical protein GAK31_03477 [Stenotrophomonas maltophilia]|uniref:Transmembrane protein n=1 Tax=Stenotrophomonas maltophilia TaxID=40324 RepID=A0A7V8FDR4_STEMA|nr:MAG: hypothetical protein GAK31_03477 [Stenotrophomonas maltophilia]
MANAMHRWFPAAALGLAVLAAAAHLGWEHTHGGILSHHLLNRADLPTISNAWGLLVLPVLGWLAGSVVARRAAAAPSAARTALAAWAGALAVGAALSVAFVAGSESAASMVFLGVLLTGLVLPVYRAEYLFGFVLGMTFVFGSILPTLFGLLVVGISAAAHLLLRPAGRWVLRRARS